MYILGLSAYYHDSSAAIIRDGEILAAIQEERLTRIKHDNSFPRNSIRACLNICNIDINSIDYFCFYEKPILKFDRLLETYITFAPRGFNSFKNALPLWIKDKLFQKKNLINEIKGLNYNGSLEDKVLFSEHHLSHASSAFYPSGFDEAAILTVDGVGEWATSTVSHGKNNIINIDKEILFPHSLGLLYSAFTAYLGFKVNSGEYKLMGLAPYGEPKYIDIIINNLIDIKEDGSFRLNMDYFNYCTGHSMINKKFENLFKVQTRDRAGAILQKHMDLAASIQFVTQEIIEKIDINIKKETNLKNLCLAGGVALNCVANGRIVKKEIFDNIWIQPAAGDAGGSLGAALLVWYKHFNNKRKVKKNTDDMKGSLLGQKYSFKQIKSILDYLGATYKVYEEKELLSQTVMQLKSSKVIGWFQGRMEFGPRALGSRSILADPRNLKIQKELNLKIKFRESFRPFAPSVMEEHANKWFDLKTNSPYMLVVSNVSKDCLIEVKNQEKGLKKLEQKRSLIPAVTHVDNSARVQTVSKTNNRIYYNLINLFYQQTGCPVLVNTSFNIRGEPIVCTPEDAFRCFMGTNMDILVIGKYFLEKSKQNKNLLKDYRKNFDLD